LLKNKNNLIR